MRGRPADARLPPASRVHAPRVVLGGLLRLKLKADRAALERARTDAERAWCLSVADALEALIASGAGVVVDRGDPRRRVRKRPYVCSGMERGACDE